MCIRDRIRRGKKQIIHCNDCNNDVTYNSFVDDFNIKCVNCGSIQLEVWDEKHCPKSVSYTHLFI